MALGNGFAGEKEVSFGQARPLDSGVWCRRRDRRARRGATLGKPALVASFRGDVKTVGPGRLLRIAGVGQRLGQLEDPLADVGILDPVIGADQPQRLALGPRIGPERDRKRVGWGKGWAGRVNSG